MKRPKAFPNTFSNVFPNVFSKLTEKTDWITYITRVLAFIGLWQVLSNSTLFLTHWFQ